MKDCRVDYLDVSKEENSHIQRLIDEVLDGGDSIEVLRFLDVATTFSQELPRRVRAAINEFRLGESYHALCLRGNALDDDGLGPTPSKHVPPGQTERATRPEVLHLLYASLLGETFAWTSIQNGYILNIIIPIEEDRDKPTSSGSANLFDFHTEDAFHPYAGDYLGLMCLRNPDRVGTVLSTVSLDELSDKTVSTLMERRFIVGANLAQEVPAVTAPSPIFFGNPTFPYLRINLNATTAMQGDPDAGRALAELTELVRRNATEVVLEPGDCWYFDNYRVAHAREPYEPRFDGKDRWFKRLYISTTFRRSVAFRSSPNELVLDPLAADWRQMFL